VRLVPRLCTRLLLLPACEDVTAEGEAEGTPWFLDTAASRVLLLATPPAGLTHEICLHQAICALLGASAGPSLAPLLAPAAPPPQQLLPHLRMQRPRAWAAAAIAGSPGTRVEAADEALLQLKPARAFFVGEVVAVQAEGGGYRYALVDAARKADAPADQARRLVALRTPDLAHVSPLAVFCFGTQRRPPPAADSDDAAAADAADAAADGATAAAAATSADAAAGPSEPPQPPQPPALLGSAQLMEAVASVMRRAGTPLDADRQLLRQTNLQVRGRGRGRGRVRVSVRVRVWP